MMDNTTGQRRIAFVVFNQFELLDFSGPASVFSTVDGLIGRSAYPITLLSSQGGLLRCYSGVELATEAIEDFVPRSSDTVIAVGGFEDAMRAACTDPHLLRHLKVIAPKLARVGSVCTGSFLLGAAGLIDQRRVTTHWLAAEHLARAFPNSHVESDALYVQDQELWTSAGVSSGIDMALAMVEADYGASLKSQVAKMLVVYAHRPGHQRQFSAVLDAQSKVGKPFAQVVAWIDTHLDQAIRVKDLAEVAHMSERNFSRKFTSEVGTTPSCFVEQIRLERARALLEAGESVKSITRSIGYRSEAAFRSAFERRYGIVPSMYRSMHAISTTD